MRKHLPRFLKFQPPRLKVRGESIANRTLATVVEIVHNQHVRERKIVFSPDMVREVFFASELLRAVGTMVGSLASV